MADVPAVGATVFPHSSGFAVTIVATGLAPKLYWNVGIAGLADAGEANEVTGSSMGINTVAAASARDQARAEQTAITATRENCIEIFTPSRPGNNPRFIRRAI